MGAEQPPAPAVPGWYAILPVNARSFMQLGFAGLVAFMFYMDSRDRSDEFRRALEDNRVQAREERMLTREQQQAADRRHEKLVGRIDAYTATVQKAIDRLDSAHRELKQDVRDLKVGPIPAPREKPD